MSRPVVLLLACLLVAGCGAPAASPTPAPDETASQDDTASPTESPTPEPTEEPTGASCEPQETVAIQGGEHLIGDQEPPVPYNSTPPTSGWHSSGAFEVGVMDDDEPLSEPEQVSVLEAGGVVITHHELDDAARSELEQLVRDRYDGQVAVTPYEQLEPGAVTMTAWGVLQRCNGFDEASLSAFIDAHVTEDHVAPGHGGH